MISRILALSLLILSVAGLCADPPAAKTPRDALHAFSDLIGAWKGTTLPSRSSKEFWTEKSTWEWQFKGQDAWLKVTFEKNKSFTSGELRYVPDQDQFSFTAITPAKEKHTFAGKLHNRVLTLDRESGKELQQIVFTFLHPNRILYRYAKKAAGQRSYSAQWSLGATKEGVPFAAGDGRPECVVSGGAGTLAVTYMGKTYYVCCSGCRSEFNENPAKYVKEFEAKKAKQK